MQRLLSLVASATCLTIALSSAASAQGSDACATPTPVPAGLTFAFSNATATQGSQGQSNGICGSGSQMAINRDVWFSWTAPTGGPYTLSTCGGTAVDTKIAVYNGSACPAATALACSDDACQFQSSVTFLALAGQSYVFQVGTDGSAVGGTGTCTLREGGVTCGSSVGPDVIVGDMHDIANHTVAGTLDAISVGTTSCNIGTQGLLWQSSTQLHPVIGAALYRHRVQDGAGRFEEIGMSWLKHGFTALSGSLCCQCQGGGGSVLGVGCSDPYGAGLNGSQGSLGPRWQVNAHTGVFTMPHANPTWSGSVARRLEFEVADIDTTAGVRYLAETTYVTQDDAAAGNQNNNSSWRALNVTGTTSNFTFSFASPTRRTAQGIRAWPEFEAGVTLTDVQVPGDGLFIVGSKATDIGGGLWHYEYAVHNQNADRNGGSFSVAVPAGATIQNVGFHDVPYRNGDGPGNVNYNGADWVPAIDGNGISWSCEGMSQNTSANALRWSTTYNFRFDSDAAPGKGNVKLGLWKPGTPDAMNVTAQVPMSAGTPISAYCAGDGTGGACPCGNTALQGAGTGCNSSLGFGALLGSSGSPSISNDTFALGGSGMPNAAALYFQGSVAVNGSLGAAFGDGLRCAGGSIVRLGPVTNVLGQSSYPVGADPSISIKGANAVGDVRYYQCWYRNAATFCTADTFNLTNGIQLTWLP